MNILPLVFRPRQYKKITLKAIFTFCLLFLSLLSCRETKSEDEKTPTLKKLIIGMNLVVPPLQAMDETGNPYGIFVDMARDMAVAFGQELEIVTPNFSGAIAGLNTGQYDMLSFMVITPEREKIVDFSIPCGKISVSFMVRKGFPAVKNVEELNNSKVRMVVLKGSFPESLAFKRFKKANIVSLSDLDSAILEVIQGKSDVILINPIVGHQILQKHPDKVEVYYQSLAAQDVAMALRKTEDKELLNRVNDFLADYIKSGKMTLLGDKYLASFKKAFAKRGEPFDFIF